MIKISIIIPVYNVEEYVERCLRSCAEQDISSDKYEIIVIDDGSQDNSLERINNLKNQYENIAVYSQRNLGLSVTRNAGLSLSKGEYVWFVDSDDWIEKNCIRDLIEQISDEDVIAMGYIMAYDDKSKNEVISYSSNKIDRGKELLKSVFFPQAQTYIYNRNFLYTNNLTFYEGIYHEDSEFTPRVLFYANEIKILDKPVYFFYKRQNSITTTPSIKRVYDLIIVANNLNKFKEIVPVEFHSKFNFLISLALNNALFLRFSIDREYFADMNKAFFNSRDLFTCLKKSGIMKYYIEGLLFNLFPKRVVQVYTILQMTNPYRPIKVKVNN